MGSLRWLRSPVATVTFEPVGLAVYAAASKGLQVGLPLAVAVGLHNIPGTRAQSLRSVLRFVA